MDKKIGRNDPSRCRSGKKFKRCHDAGTEAIFQGRAIGAVTDYEHNTRFIVTDDMLVNQLRRDAPRIAESFDRLCLDQLKTMSLLFGRFNLSLFGGLAKASADDDELRVTCSQLLINAENTWVAAADLLRDGFRLQPGVLIRNLLETITAVICIFGEVSHWRAFKEDRLRPEKKIGTVNKVIPFFGRLYSFYSEHFAHIRSTYARMHAIAPYNSSDKALKTNLIFLRSSLWLMYVTVELVFFDMTKPMCWKKVDTDKYLYAPTEEGMRWQETMLGPTNALRPVASRS